MPGRREPLTFAPDVVLQVIDGDALIVKLSDETVFSLNATGARIAELIRAGGSIEQLVETLTREYAVDQAEVEREVESLVTALQSRGLVVGSGGTA